MTKFCTFFLEYLLLQLNFATKINFWPITSRPTNQTPNTLCHIST
jgi:hypothetical protein